MIKAFTRLDRWFHRGKEAPARDGEAERLRAEVAALREDAEETARYFERHVQRQAWPRFADLSEVIEDGRRPPLDRGAIDTSVLTPRQRFWHENGYLILERFLPDDLIDAYVEVRRKVASPGGWRSPTPYEHVAELRELALYPPLLAVMRELISGDMVLHLNLTGWVSSERDWHQDDYLNPDTINGWYMAAWNALADIDPDCGPFEFVPGSHRWPVLRREKVCSFLAPFQRRQHGGQNDRGHWASYSEDFVAHAVGQQILDTGLRVQAFHAKRGDVLLWHACLAHRG